MRRNETAITDFRLVERLAWEVRRWAESYKNNCPYTVSYDDLAGLCGKSAARLNKLLEINNIKSEIWANDNHVFNYIDGFIIDTTATQFNNVNLQKVEIRPAEKACKFNYWHVYYKFQSAEELEFWMEYTNWTMWQRARKDEYLPCKDQ